MELVSNRNSKEHELLLEAQELAEMGSYEWNLIDNATQLTPQLDKILELGGGIIPLNEFMLHVHPSDRERVQQAFDRAMSGGGNYDCEFRYICVSGEKILWSRGKVEFKGGRAVSMRGTVMNVTARYHMIHKLQRSEELYKQAQAATHIGNWSWEMATDKVNWSDELYRIYGLEPQSERISFERFSSFIHPGDKEMRLRQLKELMRDHGSGEYIFRIVLDNGSTKVLHGNSEVLVDESGNPYKLIGTCQDVTREKIIEKQLLENQNFIKKIADATPSIITSFNVHTGVYGFVSRGVEKLLGYDPKMVLKEGVRFFAGRMHPEDLNALLEQKERELAMANGEGQTASTEKIIEFQCRILHSNGLYRWFHTYVTIFDRNHLGMVENLLNISVDITDRIEAEQKIREQEHFIQNIVDASPTIMYLLDANEGRVLYINKEIENILGYTPDEVLAMGSSVIPEIYHPEDLEKIGDRLREYKKPDHSNTLFHFECRMKHKNGQWHWLLVREIVFKTSADQRITEILGAALDITDRKQIEEKLFQQTTELAHSNTSLEEYAYVTSHDLQEPLRKISTFTDRLIAKQYASLNEEGKVYLEKILQSSTRMQKMINDLLSVSTISGDKQFTSYSLQQLLEEVLQTLEYKLEESRALVKSDGLPEANIVPSQFRQLFQNLISNSLKFAQKNGIQPLITICHRTLYPNQVASFNLANASRFLELKFADNGIGFEKEFAEKIFVIFQRLHNKHEYEGTGIGLAICKKIVENHGGVIFATGRPRQGAEFTIILPV